jgi:phenylpropionate dioxygenase-like ring-hydroxylating dioxygenase large terminal subunit
MIEQSFWHPVAQVADLAATPLAVTLLGQRLVLWRGDDGTAQAWDDRCPHRGASLSLGCVRAGPDGAQLECAYHGWRFGAGGQVVSVPALPGFVPPATHRATVYAVAERYGLLWVCLQPDAAGASIGAASIPVFAAEQDGRLRKLNCGPYRVATSAPRIVENFLDMAHFGFVHEHWLGSREHTGIADYSVVATPTGLLATGCKAWQPRSSVHAEGGAEVEYTYEVNDPYTAVLTKVPLPPETPAASPPQGGVGRLGSGPAAAEAGSVTLQDFRESIALFICPLTPETSQVWFRLAMNDFESPDEKLQAFQHTIFSQDQPVLESQRPHRLPISDHAPVRELHSAADRSATAYRRYLRERGITYGTC